MWVGRTSTMHHPAPKITFVFITLLLDVLGFGLLIPVAPQLVAAVQGLAITGKEAETAPAVGYLMATYAALQFFFAPILGSLSDRFGRRPVILISLLGSGIDYFAGALAPTLTVLFITRAINGISGANMSVCGAYIADISPPEKRAAAFGMLGAAFGLGFILGPILGGYLGDESTNLGFLGHGGVRVPYYAAGVLTLINWLYGFFVLPESLPLDRRRPFSWAKANPFGALKWLTQHHMVLALAACLFLVNLAQFGLHSVWVLSMQARFDWTTKDSGLSLCVVGITAAIVQGGLARRIIPALGERACLVGGLVVATIAFVGYGASTHSWMIYAIIAAASIGGVSGPAVQAIMSKAIAPTEQGLLQGAMSGLNSVAMVFSAIIATNVFEVFTKGHDPRGFPGAGAPFYLGAILVVLSIVPVLFVWNRMPRTVAQVVRDGEPGGPEPTAPPAH